MNKKNRPNIVLGAAAILLCLCMISAHFTMGLYARYTTRVSGKDSARAAKFDVTATVKEVQPETPASGTDASLTRSYKATITNNSEVAVCASIKMVFDKGVIITSGKIGNTVINAEDNTIVFNGTFDLAPGATRDDIEFTITFDADSAFTVKSVTNAMDPTLANGKANEDLSVAELQLPFTAIVTFVQID